MLHLGLDCGDVGLTTENPMLTYGAAAAINDEGQIAGIIDNFAMPIVHLYRITREMRGEPNAIGIPTKRAFDVVERYAVCDIPLTYPMHGYTFWIPAMERRS